MSDNKSTGKSHSQNLKPTTENSRRRVLKSVLLTGGIVTGSSALPQKWSRPVVDSVILPSHAATTDDTGNLPGDVTTTTATPTVNYYFDISRQGQASVDGIINESRSFAERALDVVVPTASAYTQPNVGPIYVCLAITGNTYTGRVIREPYTQTYQDYQGLSGTVGIGLPLTSPIEPCFGTNVNPPTMTVDQVTPTSCRCTFVDSIGSAEVTVQQNECGDPNLICDLT